MENFVLNISFIFQISVFSVTLYYLLLSLFGLYKKNDALETSSNSYKKFALIIAAHNEEMVISQIIESMKNLDYPHDFYDIFVIADNCNDDTASIARACGAEVYVRNSKDNRGKGYALEWMFGKVFAMETKYDAVAVFDADNLLSRNFLKEMNFKLNAGFKVVQGYIDSKNPHDSWISESYSIAFWTANRLFQLARSNLGLSNQIGGTGFCMELDILKKLGWGATCLTEDLEFTCKLVLNNYKVGWCHNAVVYDERPIGLKSSWVQRKRWMQGFTDVASRFFLKLMKKAFLERDFIAFDCALYTIQPFITLALGISAILTIAQNNTEEGLNIYVINYLFNPLAWKIFSIFQFLFTPLVMAIEKKLPKKMFLVFAAYSMNILIFNGMLGDDGGIVQNVSANIAYISIFAIVLLSVSNKLYFKIFIWYLLYGIYTLTWIPITLQGIIHKNKKEWSHTKHTRDISISELEKPVYNTLPILSKEEN